jgi:flavorubredoxin
MTSVHEIAPDVFRINIFDSNIQLGFNHFLIRDDEPLLYHTGYRRMFPELLAAVKTLIDPAKLRWIGWSHFESDECGALNQWLDAAPQAAPVCGFLSALLNTNDFANRAPRVINEGETFTTGRRRFRICSTAHLPHGWDASVLLEETGQTLFCSDLLFQFGPTDPVTEKEILSGVKESLLRTEGTPLGYSIPYTQQTEDVLQRLAGLKPKLLATMHGSSFRGDGERVLQEYAEMLKKTIGKGR